MEAPDKEAHAYHCIVAGRAPSIADASGVLPASLGQHLLQHRLVPADTLDLADHEFLDLGSGDRFGRAGVPAALLVLEQT